MVKEFAFRNFLKDLGFRFLMAALGVGLFAAIAFAGDFLQIEFLQSPRGVLAVLLVGGPLVLIPPLISLYVTDRI